MIKLDFIEVLYEGEDLLFAVGDGRMDMGVTATPDIAGTLPVPDFVSLPGLFATFSTSVKEMDATLNDPRMQEIMIDVYGEQGVFPLSNTIDAPQVLWGNKPVLTLEDWKGLKVRTSGLVQAKTAEALGAAPLIVTDTEIEQLLIRGTVDAAITDMPYGAARGFLDICSYASMWEVTPTMLAIVMINTDIFNGLHPKYQEVLQRAGREAMATSLVGIEMGYGNVMEWVATTDLEVVYPPQSEVLKMGALLKPVYEEWLKIAGPYGPEVLAIASKYGTGGGAAIAAELGK